MQLKTIALCSVGSSLTALLCFDLLVVEQTELDSRADSKMSQHFHYQSVITLAAGAVNRFEAYCRMGYELSCSQLTTYIRAIIIVLSVQMLMDPMGGIVMTNDGSAIVREVRPVLEAAQNGRHLFSLRYCSDPGAASRC